MVGDAIVGSALYSTAAWRKALVTAGSQVAEGVGTVAMQLALYGSIAWRHPLGIGQVMDWAARCGWDCIDARGMSLGVPGDRERNENAFGYDMLGPRQLRSSARRELRQRLEASGTPLLGVYCSSSVNLPGEAGDHYRQLFRDYLQLASDLGAPWIRAINNTTQLCDGQQCSPAEAYDRTVAGLTQLAPVAADLGVGLLLENNENTVTADADSLLAMKTDLGTRCRVGIAYDPVNAWFQGLEPQPGLERLAGQIDVLHVKNVRRHQSAQWNYMPRGDYGYEWTALADGDLDWQQLLAQAYRGGFAGPLTYEYVNPFKGMPLSYWDALPEPEMAAQREAAYLRQLIDGLPGLNSP